MIDNHDSFTYIIVQYLQQLKQLVVVKSNNQWTLSDISAAMPKAIVIGPGPGRPEQAGITLDIIRHFAGKIPIFGICLGHQAIAMAYGAEIIQADHIMHGRVSAIYHHEYGVFKNLPSPINMTRYHSLVIDKTTLPDTLEVTAWTQSNQFNTTNVKEIDDIMAIRHRHLALEGVQFHPESILSEAGFKVLNNFLTTHGLAVLSNTDIPYCQ